MTLEEEYAERNRQLKEYADEQIKLVEEISRELLEEVRAWAAAKKKANFENVLQSTREKFEKGNEEALQRFNVGMIKLEQDRQKGMHPKLLIGEEQRLRNNLADTLKGNKELLDYVLRGLRD